MDVEVRFAVPRALVVLTSAGRTDSLPPVRAVRGRVRGLSLNRRVLRLEISGVTAGEGQPGHSRRDLSAMGASVWVRLDEQSVLERRSRRELRAEWVVGSALALGLMILSFRGGL